MPYADTWSAGWQRALTRNMAMEVRYAGTRSRGLWTTYNYNEVNIHENGVPDEFRLAQANLLANVAAGRGETFRYFGPGTGTSPLPISLAYFSGRIDAGNPAADTSSNFRSSMFTNGLDPRDPDVFNFATNLDGNSGRRANALAAGLAPKFLVANPDKLGGASVTGNGDYTNYHSLQMELRRRMSQGLKFQMSFGRFQSSEIIDFGNLRMVGFDINDLRDMYGVRKDADGIITYLPEDVIENTIRAFSTDPGSPTGYSAAGPPSGRYFAPAGGPDCIETIDTGYGSCGERDIFIDSPWMKNMDISVVKAVPIAGRVRAEFRIEMLNAFNWINYDPVTGVGGTTRDSFETNSLTGLTQSRIIQLVSRVSW